VSRPEHAPAFIARAAHQASETERRYEGDADRPLGGYLGVLAGYAATLGGFAALLRATGRRLPERFDTHDLVLMAVATHKLARLVAKDPVTSPLRAPFTRYAGTAGPSELHEEVRAGGSAKALGELLTCPFCVGHWIATGFAFGLVLAPRPTRLMASVFSVLAASDVLQYVYSALQEREVS
jgi:hypothetical protein